MMAVCSYAVWFYFKIILFTEKQTEPIFPISFQVQPTEIPFIFSPCNLQYSTSTQQHTTATTQPFTLNSASTYSKLNNQHMQQADSGSFHYSIPPNSSDYCHQKSLIRLMGVLQYIWDGGTTGRVVDLLEQGLRPLVISDWFISFTLNLINRT